MKHDNGMHGTTIIAVRTASGTAIGGDGQVTLNDTVIKSGARKIRKLLEGKVIVGFAGGTADAFALLERFEKKLKESPGSTERAAVSLAKEWRTDRILQRLNAVLVVTDARHIMLLTGTGDVVEPDDGIIAVGSGGSYALAAARALVGTGETDAVTIVKKSLEIAADICVYTNRNIIVEEVPNG
jgi:ATP-dependent HslUV protease subunit HslV